MTSHLIIKAQYSAGKEIHQKDINKFLHVFLLSRSVFNIENNERTVFWRKILRFSVLKDQSEYQMIVPPHSIYIINRPKIAVFLLLNLAGQKQK